MEGCQLHDVKSWRANFVENNRGQCFQKLQEYETWKQIPNYSAPHSHHYTDGQLVRIQGMIQDMHNPEYYISKYVVHNKTKGTKEERSGKYRDIMKVELEEEIIESANNQDAKERQSFFCIPIPAQTKWGLDMHKSNLVLPEMKGVNDSSVRGQKRRADDGDEEMVVEDGSAAIISESNGPTTVVSSPQRKKAEVTASTQSSNQPSITYEEIQKFSYPIKGIEGQSFILKIYDSEENILMNDIVEAVGFLSLDPAISCLTGDEEMASMDQDGQAERMQHQPPPSLVPRLHVLSIKKMEHCNPLLPSFGFDSAAAEAFKLAEAAVCDLKIIFTPLLLGDKLAVEFLICNLISKIFVRKDVTNLGHLSVNFHEVPTLKDYAVHFYNILEQLVTKSHYFPLTIDGLNSTPFVPKKDYTTDKLRSGLLQLSPGTHLVFDETKMSVGQLQDMGTRNVLALQDLLARQEVAYDFQFYTTQFNADIPVIVFSEKKSLLTCDARVPLECDADAVRVLENSFEAANMYLKREEVVSRIRAFLSAAKLANYEIPEDMQKKVQDDFVEMRQQDKNFKGEDLHFVLNLARLLTLSKGQHVLTADVWKQACDMEGARRARL